MKTTRPVAVPLRRIAPGADPRPVVQPRRAAPPAALPALPAAQAPLPPAPPPRAAPPAPPVQRAPALHSPPSPPPPTVPAPTHAHADAPPPYSESPPPPAYSEVPRGGFDPRALTDFQLDELTHRLTGRITRLLRTELRLDRERIGRLRDPRH
ncbi:extensin [Streptomyces sp. NPDC058335]|uniref:extensin n=1 Tax=Streptomyces sp. NPDC058335 TaxID=3346451 RepID=UPI003667A18C